MEKPKMVELEVDPITHLEGPCLLGFCVRVDTNRIYSITWAIEISLLAPLLFMSAVLIFPQFSLISLAIYSVIATLQMRILQVHKVVSFERIGPEVPVAHGAIGWLYWTLKLEQLLSLMFTIWIVFEIYS